MANNNNSDRLDRIESIVESNVKAIQALSDDIGEMKRDRDTIYSLMSELTGKMSELTGKQISTYTIMKNLDERQSQLANQQAQLIEIIKSLADK